MVWVKDINSFYDFLGYVVLRAPDRFPVEDFLQDEEQMNLEKAFIELRKGIGLLDQRVADEEKRKELAKLLDESFSAYKSGNDVKGAHLLQDLEEMIFKK